LPILGAIESTSLDGAARGLVYHLTEKLAPVERRLVEPLVSALDASDQRRLARLGVRIGQSWVFLPALLKPAAVRVRAALWRAASSAREALPLPPPGRVSVAVAAGIDQSYYAAIGYPVVGRRAIRVDMLDRLVARLRRTTIQGAMAADSTIAPVLGCSHAEADEVLLALGWGRDEVDGATIYRRQKTRSAPRRRSPPRADIERSPFAVLKQLATAK